MNKIIEEKLNFLIIDYGFTFKYTDNNHEQLYAFYSNSGSLNYSIEYYQNDIVTDLFVSINGWKKKIRIKEEINKYRSKLHIKFRFLQIIFNNENVYWETIKQIILIQIRENKEFWGLKII